jgi:protein-disulfide isomerase
MADTTETRKERRATARAERDRAAEAAQARRRQRLWILGGALALAAAIVVAIAVASGGGNDKPALKAGEQLPGQTEVNARFAGLPQRGIALGEPRAPLTLVEFADLQCPFCRDYTVGVMPAIVDKYVRAGKLRMEFRNVSFIGTDSSRAAQMAAAAALQDKLWEYADLFYTNQGEENTGYVTDDFLRRIGGGVRGLDVSRAMNDRGLPDVQRQMNEAQTAWQTNGFTGTPSFLLGPTDGKLSALGPRDALTVDSLSGQIDKALAAASG